MDERYDKGVFPNELLLRNAILSRTAEDWERTPPPHLPVTVSGNSRAEGYPQWPQWIPRRT